MMSVYLERIFFPQNFFEFARKARFIIHQLGKINNSATSCTYKMMVVPPSVRSCSEFVSSPAIAEIELEYNTHPAKDFKCAVHCRQSNSRVAFMHFHKEFFSTQVLVGRAQYFKNSLARYRHSIPIFTKSSMPPSRMFHLSPKW